MAHRVVIIGGGFGGLYAAKALRRAPVEITLIDRRNFHLFQPLLYQVATGTLSPANIAAPLRALLKRQGNTRVLLGEVTDFDPAHQRVIHSEGVLEYDSLIVAAGSRNSYFGNDAWATAAPGLKSIEDATEIRRRVLLAFEMAENSNSVEREREFLTFVVVGGGPTGVELAGQVAEMARHTLTSEFRKIHPETATVYLVEGSPRILSSFPPELIERGQAQLERLGVTVRTGVSVSNVTPEEVTLRAGDREEILRARTVLWGAGVQASGLGARLAAATGAKLDRTGRVIVRNDTSIEGHPNLFVIGDLAHFVQEDGRPLPGVAPVAMQQGRYVADLIARRLRGAEAEGFRYVNKGNLATIGRNKAVADLGWIRFSGYFAWLTWLFVHILYLAQFQNRLLVMTQWAWNYWTRNRAARLITGEGMPQRGNTGDHEPTLREPRG